MDDISISLSGGDFVAMHGPSGCGKSTLLLMAGGLLSPDEGTLTIAEQRIHMTRTPIMISAKGTEVKWFYRYNEAKAFKSSDEAKGFKHRYIKGLASLTEDEYYSIINKPVFSTIDIDKPVWFDVMMGSDSGPRKEWLSGQVPLHQHQ